MRSGHAGRERKLCFEVFLGGEMVSLFRSNDILSAHAFPQHSFPQQGAVNLKPKTKRGMHLRESERSPGRFLVDIQSNKTYLVRK